jgi:hypothetical protein
VSPKTYRKIVHLLADPCWSVIQISKARRVSEHTVRAIREREAVAIAERKQRLISVFGNVDELAGERMEELAGKASLRDAGITAGIATDKLLALLGETGGVPLQVNMQVNAELLHQRYQELIASLPRKAQTAENKESLPNGETLSGSPAAMERKP